MARLQGYDIDNAGGEVDVYCDRDFYYCLVNATTPFHFIRGKCLLYDDQNITKTKQRLRHRKTPYSTGYERTRKKKISDCDNVSHITEYALGCFFTSRYPRSTLAKEMDSNGFKPGCVFNNPAINNIMLHPRGRSYDAIPSGL